MISKSPITKIGTDNTDLYVTIGMATLYALPYIAPLIDKATDKLLNLAHDAMEHGYDMKLKIGSAELALTQNNKD